MFVELAGTTDVDLVSVTVLKALGLQTSSTEIVPQDHLTSYLSDRSMLLILDNFEQLIDARKVVSTIHGSSPRVAVLVTSRVPLRLPDEIEVTVPPLATSHGSDEMSEADRLFVRRATSVRSGFVPTDDDLRLNIRPDTATRRAASGHRAGRVAAPGTHPGATARQARQPAAVEPVRRSPVAGNGRSMRTIDWSYDLLTEPARRLFTRMSTFLGGAGLDELVRVCRDDTESEIDVLDNLGELIDHSLIPRDRRLRLNTLLDASRR